MKADYHIHTKLCKHASGEMEEYVNAAVTAGLDEIGFADHSPMPSYYDQECRMMEHELPGYINSVLSMQESFANISIKLGIEADFAPGTEEYVRRMTDNHPFDYVLGSVHYLDDWGFDNPVNLQGFQERDINEVYARYFTLMTDAARSGLFDIISHPDLVKKFGHFPTVDYKPMLIPFLDAMRESGLCLEVNTSGLRKPVGEVYPGVEYLKIAREMDIPITIGSDAHDPSEVAWHFTETRHTLKEIGYEKTALFNKREISYTTL